jgi:hypothetical protein
MARSRCDADHSYLLGRRAIVKAQEPIDPDPAAVEVINALIEALEIDDEAQRTAALVPLLHPVLLTSDGTDLIRNFKMIIGRRLERFQGFVKPADFDSVVRVGGGHQFGSLQVESVDRYRAKKADGGTSLIPIVWTEAGTAKVVGLPG